MQLALKIIFPSKPAPPDEEVEAKEVEEVREVSRFSMKHRSSSVRSVALV